MIAATTLTLLLLAAPVGAQQGAPSSAETYGAPSGDVPARGLGLVLELVDAGTTDARLRLFGGVAGQDAAIVVGTESRDAAGPHGERVLVGGLLERARGAFDMTGTFEVPFDHALPAGARLFAQGAHTGAFDLGPGGRPLVQVSNGLEVHGASDAREPLGFDDLLPHLPDETPDLPLTATLAERLQVYLNSEGDATRIQLHIEGNGGAGAYVGGAIDMEVLAERTSEGLYELRLSRDAAVTAGAELAEGLEAGVAAGVGATEVFRFHSAPGLARGLFGVIAALQSPGLVTGDRVRDSEVLRDLWAEADRIEGAVEAASRVLARAEDRLRSELDQAVVRAAGRRAAALRGMRRAGTRLAAANWRQAPARVVVFTRASARFTAAHARLVAATAARRAGQRIVDTARAQLEAHREDLRAVLARRARVMRVVSALLQTRGYAARHHAGTELRMTGTGSVDLGVPLPVKLANLKAGVGAEVGMVQSVLFEVPDADGRFRIIATRELRASGSAAAAAVAGAECESSLTGTIVETFELGAGRGVAQSVEGSLARDLQVRGFAGARLVHGIGAGRRRSISLDGDVPIAAQIASFVTGADGSSGSPYEVGFDLQDRSVRTIEFDLIVSVAGNGGGVEVDVEWADQGRLLSRTWTLDEARDALTNGAARVPDAAGGTVAVN